MVDPEFFDILSFNFIKGNKEDFNYKYTAIISDEFANKHFADVDPVGQILTINKREVTIVGVVEYKNNSAFRINIVQHIAFQSEYGVDVSAWGSNSPWTFFESRYGQTCKKIV